MNTTNAYLIRSIMICSSLFLFPSESLPIQSFAREKSENSEGLYPILFLFYNRL
jgi:hypothetical protein